MRPRDPVGDGKARSRAAARAGRIAAGEGIDQAQGDFGAQPGAGIGDADRGPPALVLTWTPTGGAP